MRTLGLRGCRSLDGTRYRSPPRLSVGEDIILPRGTSLRKLARLGEYVLRRALYHLIKHSVTQPSGRIISSPTVALRKLGDGTTATGTPSPPQCAHWGTSPRGRGKTPLNTNFMYYGLVWEKRDAKIGQSAYYGRMFTFTPIFFLRYVL